MLYNGFYRTKYRIMANTTPIYMIMGMTSINNNKTTINKHPFAISLANFKLNYNPFELVLTLVPGVDKSHKCFWLNYHFIVCF